MYGGEYVYGNMYGSENVQANKHIWGGKSGLIGIVFGLPGDAVKLLIYIYIYIYNNIRYLCVN